MLERWPGAVEHGQALSGWPGAVEHGQMLSRWPEAVELGRILWLWCMHEGPPTVICGWGHSWYHLVAE